MTNWTIRILSLAGLIVSFAMALVYAAAGIAFLFVFGHVGAVTASNAQQFIQTNAILSSSLSVRIITSPLVIELSIISWGFSLFWMVLHSFGTSYIGLIHETQLYLIERRTKVRRVDSA